MAGGRAPRTAGSTQHVARTSSSWTCSYAACVASAHQPTCGKVVRGKRASQIVEPIVMAPLAMLMVERAFKLDPRNALDVVPQS